MELDPLSPGLNARLGAKLGLRGDYDRALEQLQKALEFDPNFVFIEHCARAYLFPQGNVRRGSSNVSESGKPLREQPPRQSVVQPDPSDGWQNR